MPGPYYQAWDGDPREHPSHQATPEEIESIQTVDDVRRLFPDYNAATDPNRVTSTGSNSVKFTPESLAKMHVDYVRRENPYTCWYWWQIWKFYRVPAEPANTVKKILDEQIAKKLF